MREITDFRTFRLREPIVRYRRTFPPFRWKNRAQVRQ
jgi:hypothetical protein